MRACEAWGLGGFFCLGVLVFAGLFLGGEVGVGFFQFVFLSVFSFTDKNNCLSKAVFFPSHINTF